MQNNHDDFLGHPKGLYVCFATEMWERFSFYGMKYLLLLYLTKYHLFSDVDGLDVLGAYAGLVYVLPLIGGLLADRYLGTRRSVIFGGILLSIGHFLMAVEGEKAIYYAAGTQLVSDLYLSDGRLLLAGSILETAITKQDTAALQVFYLALTFIVVGVGFLKPNISVIVGKLYRVNDPRRDSGFTLFYMGINVGAFVATFVCGWLGETYGWKYGFGLAGVGMLIGILTFLYGQRYLMGYAESPCPEWLAAKYAGLIKREWMIYLATMPTMLVIWWLIQHEPVVHVTQNIALLFGIIGILAFSMIYPSLIKQKKAVAGFALLVIFAGVLAIFTFNKVVTVSEITTDILFYIAILLLLAFVAYGYLHHKSVEFTRTLVLMVLIISTVVFWSLFEQSSASMTLFADRSLNREIAGVSFVASQVASLNPAFITLFAIPFAFLWPWLETRGLNPSTPVKFALGTIQAGLGFGALVLGAQFPDEAGKVGAIWMILAYLLHSTGELCLSPIGLSAVTSLSIPRVVGVSMGTWFVATALSETLATRLAKMAALDTANVSDPAQILATYTQLFEFLMWVGLGFGIFMLLLSPLLKRGMGGVR